MSIGWTRITAILVAVVLLGLVFYPGTFAPAYESDSSSIVNEAEYMIAHEDDPVFDAIAHKQAARDDPNATLVDPEPTPVADLSPAARQVFTEGHVQPLEPRPNDEHDWRVYEPGVCTDYVLVCDGLRDHPEEISRSHAADSNDRYLLVADDDGEQWLLTSNVIFTDILAIGDPWLGLFVFRLAILAPYAGVLVLMADNVRDSQSRTLRTLTGGGLALAVLAVGYPSLLALTGSSLWWPLPVILVTTWATLYVGRHTLYRAIGPETDADPDT